LGELKAMTKIVVIGSLNFDIVVQTPRLPKVGETLFGTHAVTDFGGKGANQAYAAARLGGDVAMLGRVGSDEFGKEMCTNLVAAGCDVSGVQSIDGASGVALIMVAESGQNSIMVVPGANFRYRPEDLRGDADRIAGAEHVLLQLETPLNTVLAAAQLAKSQGAQVILDPAPVPQSLPPQLLRTIDILTPNEVEASQLAGRPGDSLTMDDIGNVCTQLLSAGVKTVILKLGERGCFLAQGVARSWIPAPRVDVVDTTAAGDVFNAALAVACSEGASLIEGCRFAVRAAALSVTRFGAQRSVPSRKELNTFPPTGEAPVNSVSLWIPAK
jgi:ribokinase